MVVADSFGQLAHELLFQHLGVIDLLPGFRLKARRLVRRKAQILKQVGARLCDMADLGLNGHLVAFLVLAMAR